MSFENAMKHHNFRSEIMSYTNLLQNQMMIFQNKQMIDAQTQTNLYLSQTNAHLLEVEKIRKKERQIDIWMEEFKYQGMSPIEAQNQEIRFVRILQCIFYYKLAYKRFIFNSWSFATK